MSELHVFDKVVIGLLFLLVNVVITPDLRFPIWHFLNSLQKPFSLLVIPILPWWFVWVSHYYLNFLFFISSYYNHYSNSIYSITFIYLYFAKFISIIGNRVRLIDWVIKSFFGYFFCIFCRYISSYVFVSIFYVCV